MTDEEFMRTSDITARLRHNSVAVTRDWIRKRKLVADSRDIETGEKLYRRSAVEEAIAAMTRGPYLKTRPPGEERTGGTTEQPD